MKDRALDLLGLMLRANVLSVGETNTGAAVKTGKARLVIVAADASDNAKHRAAGFVYGKNVPMLVLPFTKDELSDKLGRNGCSMAAVCDLGFADALLKLLPDADGEICDVISERLARERQRGSKKCESNNRRGLRRNNA